jgi:hypothetical protein
MAFVNRYFRLLLLVLLAILIYVLYEYSQNGRYQKHGAHKVFDTQTGETESR